MDKTPIESSITEIKFLYTQGLHSLQMIADKFKCTRQYIKKILNKHGVQTAKGIHTQVKCVCLICSKEFYKKRARVRNLASVNDYCSKACYYKMLYDNNYNEDRSASRNARFNMATLILGTIKLPAKSIVHHVDGNQNNNAISNLMLLKDQATHIRIHRRVPFDKSNIYFDGRLDSPEYRKACTKLVSKLVGIA